MTKLGRDVPFMWGVGIEDTNIGWPLLESLSGLDEYELTQHYENWQHDIELASSIGANSLRYGFPWYRVNPAPGVFDWSFTDGVVSEANRKGLGLIVDLVHYGTPPWLTGSFTDPIFPAAVAHYAASVASRYGEEIVAITPLNEPLITASFTGQRGVWPPHDQGDDGWARVVVSLAEGLQQSVTAIRAAAPQLLIIHVEASHIWKSGDASLSGELALWRERSFLPTDLLLGRVDTSHGMHAWLLNRGIDSSRLSRLVDEAAIPDAVGINYYPELSPRELVQHNGSVVAVAFNAGSRGLEAVVTDFHQRYQLPILIAETAMEGSDDQRIGWLNDCVESVVKMRRSGLPIIGITWWPLFDFVDWSWATGDQVIEEFYGVDGGEVVLIRPPMREAGIDAFLRRMGLFRLERDGDDLRRVFTPVADAFRILSRSMTRL